MAKSRPQSSAFDLMAAFSENPVPSVPGGPPCGGTGKGTPPPVADAAGKAAPKKPRPRPKRPPAAKAPQKARNGSTPCERPLSAKNVMLYDDQLRPLALLEIDTGENRSELIRRLVDAELAAKGYR